ncbi:MAG: DUF5717 family protein, partial [Defluviitaleaceae bacterium]|nr:DUF5717 family protein [Defluviitaleaceae bacterium]
MTNNTLTHKITKLEAIYRKSDDNRSAWLLSLRYYQLYRLTGDKDALLSASDLSKAYYAMNFHSMQSLLLHIYIEIDLNGSAKAQELLDKLKPLRNVIKQTPFLHAAHLYIDAIMDFKRGKARASRKAAAALLSLAKSEKNVTVGHYIQCFLASYYITTHDREAALTSLLNALETDESCSFLYILIGDFLVREEYTGVEGTPLIAAYLRYALSNGLYIDLIGVMERNKQVVLSLCASDKILCRALADALDVDWLLTELVKCQIKDREFSITAYKYYCMADNKQLALPGLAGAIVMSAYTNKIYDLGRYALERYFAEDYERGGQVEAFAVYLAHFLYPTLLKPAEITDINDLFEYDIFVENRYARYLWIFEDRKSTTKIAELNETDGLRKATITASTPEFGCIVFDESMKNIIGAAIVIRRKIGSSPNVAAYETAYKHGGAASLDLCIALSAIYMADNGLTQDNIDILRHTAELKGISNGFRAKIHAALGVYYADKNDYASAIEYFKTLSYGLLNKRETESLLLALTGNGNHTDAASLISKGADISDKTMFYVLRKIAADSAANGNTALNRNIAAAAYRLTLSNWYDKNLVNTTLTYARANQTEWQNLSRTLLALNAPVDALDEIILKTAIWTNRFDIGAQKVFKSLYSRNPDNAYIITFALYAAYKIIINNIKPEYETVDVMESLCRLNPEGDA